jgi:hypothetical protein
MCSWGYCFASCASTGAKCAVPNDIGTVILNRPRRFPFGWIVSRAASNSAKILRACSRKVDPASVRAAPRVDRASNCAPRSSSSRVSRRLTIDFDRPRRRAAAETPPASATSTNVCKSSRSTVVAPLTIRRGLPARCCDAQPLATQNSAPRCEQFRVPMRPTGQAWLQLSAFANAPLRGIRLCWRGASDEDGRRRTASAAACTDLRRHRYETARQSRSLDSCKPPATRRSE